MLKLNTRKRKVTAMLLAPVIAAAGTVLGLALSPSSPTSVHLPYADSNGVNITSVCTGTNPEFLVHAGGADITAYPGTTHFDVTYGGNGQTYQDPYVNAGYNSSDWSGNCNNPKVGLTPALPARVGSQQGNPVASIHTVTGTGPSDYFYGDTGYDLWFTPSPADNNYADMEGSGPFGISTEVMIWTSNTNLVLGTTNPAYYPVVIDGQHWYVQVGLAKDGHGTCTGGKKPSSISPDTAVAAATDKVAKCTDSKGWNVVNFIAPNNHVGNVTMTNLRIDPFLSYVIDHGDMIPNAYWEGFNAGFEITEGNAALAGFSVAGLG